MNIVTGELDDTTGRWEEQPRDHTADGWYWETLDCLPVEGVTGIEWGYSDDYTYRLNALKTIRVADDATGATAGKRVIQGSATGKAKK